MECQVAYARTIWSRTRCFDLHFDVKMGAFVMLLHVSPPVAYSAAPRLAQALLTGICPAPLAQLKVKPFFHACHSTDTFDHHAHVWRTSSIWICCADAALVLVHPSIFVTHAYERRTCFCAEGCAPAHDDSIIGFLTHEPVFNEECFRYAWDK